MQGQSGNFFLSWGCPQPVADGLTLERLCGAPAHDATALDLPAAADGAWPVRIHTLGRFALVIDDAPVAFAGKAPHKPIELLQALVALGGRDVHAERLIEAVWPGDDSADARSLFDNTLHRLRRLLRTRDALVLHECKLTLDAARCWVDAWAFERLAGAAEGAHAALRLYQGHFLERETRCAWALAYRARLRSRLHRLLLDEGERLHAAGDADAALRLYERGLELDPLAEDLYRALMRGRRARGERAEALRVYRRCREQLHAALGVPPSPATEALAHELLPRLGSDL